MTSESSAASVSKSPLAIFKTNKWLRRIAWFVIAILLLGVILWLAVPLLLRSNVERYGSEFLGREVKVGEVQFKPWALQLSVHDLSIASADGASSQVEVGRIYIDAALQSLVKLAPVLDAIEVDAPRVRVAHVAEGQFDFDDILKRIAERPKKEDEKPSDPQHFALYNIVLRDGAVEFDDRVVGRKQQLDKLEPVALGASALDGLLADSVVARLTVSSLPPLPFASVLRDLLDYPYGCIEQTTSKGFGSLLLTRAEAIARESGHQTISLIAADTHRDALRLYRAKGFREIARRPVEKGDWQVDASEWILFAKPV